MVNNEQIICNAMRETWRMLVELVNNASQILNKMLTRITDLIDTIVNSVFRHIRETLAILKDMVAAYAGLTAIDQSMARRDFCKILYACQPASDLIWRHVSPDIYKWIKGPDKFSTPDLSKWGLPQMTFNSKYEVFDYVACRLSLKGLYDTLADNFISSIMEFLNDYRQYVTVEWYLENTWLGRFLVRQMQDYEDVFNEYPKKYMAMLEPYLECAFTGCDYTFSTTNYFEDFRAKYKIGKDNIKNPLENWKVYRSEMITALQVASDGAISDIVNIVPPKVRSGYEEQVSKEAATDYVVQRNNAADDLLEANMPKRDNDTRLTPTSTRGK